MSESSKIFHDTQELKEFMTLDQNFRRYLKKIYTYAEEEKHNQENSRKNKPK
jgi:hypothetical protein